MPSERIVHNTVLNELRIQKQYHQQKFYDHLGTYLTSSKKIDRDACLKDKGALNFIDHFMKKIETIKP